MSNPMTKEEAEKFAKNFRSDDDDIQEYARPCPNCEYHRQRAQRWREEAYKLSGHPLPEREQEPVACKECHLKDLVYDLLGELKVANLKLSVRAKRTWVGLTEDEVFAVSNTLPYADRFDFAEAIEAKLKERNA